MTKFAFKIRNHHGVCIDKLHIYGRTEEESKRKLFQMYPRWEIIDTGIVSTKAMNDSFAEPTKVEKVADENVVVEKREVQYGMFANPSYEDVIDLIVSHL